jgi:hypothetical protein
VIQAGSKDANVHVVAGRTSFTRDERDDEKRGVPGRGLFCLFTFVAVAAWPFAFRFLFRFGKLSCKNSSSSSNWALIWLFVRQASPDCEARERTLSSRRRGFGGPLTQGAGLTLGVLFLQFPDHRVLVGQRVFQRRQMF